ncbi:uncharacterized protein G2W53_017621 [Senna tora]|uniref:Uncharacterized protein n=1 Tax=Senna tora TaxID=362788 RepID=A0A834TR77_9FABA|nr:uncharacterized protein G2W53_017621 [Senna tora]
MECSLMCLLAANKESHHREWRILLSMSEEMVNTKPGTNAKDRHSSCDQGGPDKAHTHFKEKGSTSRAKTRSFPSASWLTLMISAFEAKTKSYVYWLRVNVHGKDKKLWEFSESSTGKTYTLYIKMRGGHAKSRHQLIKQAQRTVASMHKVNKAKKVQKDRVLRPYSNRRRATTLNLQLSKCRKPTQQDSM